MDQHRQHRQHRQEHQTTSRAGERRSPGEGDAELHRLLVETVRDYAIFALDPRGQVLTWNAGAERFKGYAPAEIIGRHFSAFYTPEDMAAGKPARALQAAARTGRYEDEGWRVRKDGTRFWANVVLTALRDEAGELVGFAKVTRDLTERRAAEEQVRRLAAELAAREAAERRAREVERLNEQLRRQTMELEAQTEEAQSLSEELEESNEHLQDALARAEESRADAEAAERYTAGVLGAIADPFVVHDREWRFRYVNAPAAAILRGGGREPAPEVIGRVLWEMYPALAGTVFEREMRRAMTERVPVAFEAFYPERGEWSSIHCYPLPDGGLASQWQDVTHRRQAEEAARYLARASDILAGSLDYETTLAELARLVVPDLADWCAVHVVADDGAVRQLAVAHVDPDKVRLARELELRYPSRADAAHGVPAVLRSGRPELIPEITDELLAAGAVDDEHLRITRALGLRSAMVLPLAAHGRVLGALTLVAAESGRRYGGRDLELAGELARRAAMAVDNARVHRAELEARHAAERANRAKGDFLAVMSHELRTPLNAIAGHVQLMAMGIHGPVTDAQRGALDRVERAQRHLLHLINDVLNLARLETGQTSYEIAPVEVRDVLADLASLVEPQFAARGIGFTACFPEDGGGPPLRVAADREKLLQILTNLLANAAKFTPPRGAVSLELEPSRQDAAMACIRVTDSGPGIPPDKLEAVFQPFVQLDRTLTSAHEGTGLGLAISRDLARGMGGDLVARHAPGRGATLELTLPRA